MPGRRVFTIEPGTPFLRTLVDGLIGGNLVGPIDLDDPFALAATTIYLPTRRAARAIREDFLDALGRPLLLPRIRALGDIDEDEDGEDIATEAAAVPAAERQIVLARLVLAWSQQMLAQDGDTGLRAAPADAIRLAGELGRLIDQVGISDEAWAGLFRDAPRDLAGNFEITRTFLEIATRAWPDYLARDGRADPGANRDRMLRAEADRLRTGGSSAPVVAAGSTGSQPATAELLAAIAALPNGAVVLPGLDLGLDAATFAAIGGPDDGPAGAGHPQFGLKKLIETLGIRREDVRLLGEAPPGRRRRNGIVSEALRPAATTERWSVAAVDMAGRADALAGVSIVEAANEREEALTIALVLREAAGRERIAALVTPDRGLARRVAVELRRWGIDVDDSAGQPLAKSPPGIFARLVAGVALNGARAEPLLAMLKHPLAMFGMQPETIRPAARALERAVLRGPRLKPGVEAVRHALLALAEERERVRGAGERQGLGQAARGLGDGGWRRATVLADRLVAVLQPLTGLADAEEVPLADLVAAHAEALKAAATDRSGASALFAGEAGEALSGAFEELLPAAAAAGLKIAPRDYPDAFAALVDRRLVRPRAGLDPRIHIWGALEARLQHVETMVLGSLNEGVWPSRTRADPLLSRSMRAALALEPPERRIGLAAHDFAQALGHAEVWLTRAARQDGEPKVASRWLQRLAAYAGKSAADRMLSRGAAMLSLAQRLDAPAAADPPRRPRPSPPLALRPAVLPATQVETLIRDPYAVYARYVLRLRRFEGLAEAPGAADRGTLVHGILEAFVGECSAGPFDAAALERLIAIARAEFSGYADFPEIATLWWPRFERIAAWFVKAEASRDDVLRRTVEGEGILPLGGSLTIVARADRLDLLADGRIGIVDYKTGSTPTPDEVLALSPQLPIEALVALAGGFPVMPAGKVGRLDYYQISGRGPGGEICPRGFRSGGKKADVTLEQCIALTAERLRNLAAYFAQPDAEYLSRKIPKQGRAAMGEYDHLARFAEWSVADLADAELW